MERWPLIPAEDLAHTVHPEHGHKRGKLQVSAELISRGDHDGVRESQKSSSMDRTGKSKTCRFYDELHATTSPAVLFDSFNGDGGNTEAGFGDEEDDDDEVVDSSQQASGEPGFPNSQELFLTLDLEPVPPEPTQGCLPTRQAEKGPLEPQKLNHPNSQVTSENLDHSSTRERDRNYHEKGEHFTPEEAKGRAM
ncbi:hypothetical protein UY3_00206 [Chelonia mydas]|uniref:Uncharacterized protein n=1 Tax=Chelonia mydas TaxID=8469 RepID=M7CMQ5_CHEMY|nr:hypothetical protein UY3_00206 [Chelonia mydas]